MTEQTQPRDHGKYSFKQQSEAGVALDPESSTEKLADVVSGLAIRETQLDAEEYELDDKKREIRNRRARLAGASAASAILTELPNAATLSYTRSPLNGDIQLEEIQDATGKSIFQAGSLNYPLYADAETTRRRGVIRRAVDGLKSPDRNHLPDFSAQGITFTTGYSEQLNLAVAIDDGLEVLDADDLTPEQASTGRVENALSGYDSDEDGAARVQDLFTDLRHYADNHGIDLHEALEASYGNYLREKNDPAFKEGF